MNQTDRMTCWESFHEEQFCTSELEGIVKDDAQPSTYGDKDGM